MALCTFTRIMASMPTRILMNKMILPRFSSLWTPDYLDAMKPKIPQYPVVNVQIRGYDFPILESYQGFISRLADQLDFDVDSSYALAPKIHKIPRYKQNSTIIDVEYKLKMYERNTQLSNLSSTNFAIFMRLVEAGLPEGVILNFEEWNPEKEEYRYVPDKELLDLKSELHTMKRK